MFNKFNLLKHIETGLCYAELLQSSEKTAAERETGEGLKQTHLVPEASKRDESSSHPTPFLH